MFAQVFATAGADQVVRVHDEHSSAPLVELTGRAGGTAAGHANSVFSLVWRPEDEQVRIATVVKGGRGAGELGLWGVRKNLPALAEQGLPPGCQLATIPACATLACTEQWQHCESNHKCVLV